MLSKTGIAASLLLLLSGAAFGQQQVNLSAGATNSVLPDGQSVPMWGYTCGTIVAGSGATCAALNPNAGGNWSPVIITVPATATGGLRINLTNNLTFGANSIPTSIVIDGQIGGGLGLTPARMPSPTHGPQGTTWPGTLGGIDTSGIQLTNGGSGYSSPPTVNFVGGGGSDAAAFATLAPGPVGSVTRTATGSNYTSVPTVSFSGGGSGAAATARMELSAINVTNGGNNASSNRYVANNSAALTATVATPPCWTGSNTATCIRATVTVSSSAVAGTSPAQRRITGFTIGTRGLGYTSAGANSPAIQILCSNVACSGSPAVAYDATLRVNSFALTSGGTGYASAPTVAISGGGGSGASATAAISTSVASVTLTSAGMGYTSKPTITFSGGGGTGATATVTGDVNDFNSFGTPTFRAPTQVDRVRSFGTEVAGGGNAALTWSKLRPGTYLIHSGTQLSIQHPMGLYGVLVVTDANYPGTFRGAAGPVAYTFDKDAALLLSEIDPVQNIAVDEAVRTPSFSDALVWNGQTGQCGDPAVHTCYPPAVNFSPLYYLVNGVSFDRANLAASTQSILPPPATAASGRVLLRLVNAGLRTHTASLVGADMTLLAEDGFALPGIPAVQSLLLLPAGKTHDVTIQPKRDAADPTTYAAATYAFFDRQLSLSANNQHDGGMLAYISLAGGAATGAGSAASTIAAKANPDPYSVLAGNTLNVGTPTKGVIANDVGIYGVAVATAPTKGTLTLSPDGTFSYVPGATFGAGGDSFMYCGNGATSGNACALVTLNQGSAAAGPTARADAFLGKVATRLVISRPGVLGNDTDPSHLQLNAVTDADCAAPGGATLLTASQVSLNKDGAFAASVPAAGTYYFCYHAVNEQKTPSASVAATVITPAGSGLVVNVRDANDATKTISDYRWIIEEDRTVFIDPTKTSMPGVTVRNVAINFHSAVTPVVAQGCTGPVSCEVHQTLLTQPAVCDIGNGACRTDASSKVATFPGDVALDPAKRYFISILPGDSADPLITEADGHAMGGAQIAANQGAAPVDVILQKVPVNPANISIFIFEDDFPLNGEADTGGGVDVLAPNEPGLGGFNVVLMDQVGAFGDAAGQLTYDMFGNPVSNSLAGKIDPATGLDACPISPSAATRGDGTEHIVGIIVTCPKYESDGTTLSPLAGHAVVANMYAGMYEVQGVAGADRIARGERWLQTNTLDGTKAIEVFIKPNEPAYFQEFGPGGYHVAMGFANPDIIKSRKGATDDGKGLICSGVDCSAHFYGQVTATRLSRTPDQRVYDSGSYDINSFTSCYVSLSYPDAADFDFAFCDPDGKFEFSQIPTGNFKITVFDQNNDILVDGLSTPIKPANSGVGSSPGNRMHVPVMQWRTNLYGRVFLDQNDDGVSQNEEPGLPLVPFNIRYRDGSIANFNNTDLNGYAGFNEVFPRLNWLVVDTQQARYKLTGVHVVQDAGGPVDGNCSPGDGSRGCGSSTIADQMANTLESPTAHVPADLRIPGSRYCLDADCTGTGSFNPASGSAGSTARVDPGWAATQGWQGLLGSNAYIEFAMKPFMANENGGIKGDVLYTPTRPFDDPALLLQLSWAPGVANAKVNLYRETVDGNDGTQHLELVDTTSSTSWDDWAQGFRRDANGNLLTHTFTDSDGTHTGNIPNMNCPGQETDSPFFYTMRDGKFPLDENKELAARGRFKCYDGWSMLTQVQPAPYNGSYKFPSAVAKASGSLPNAVSANGQLPVGEEPTYLELDPKGFKTNCTICVPNPSDGTPMLPAGKYVVEVVVPQGYELVKEEDKNILLGDAYVGPAVTQFVGFGNIYIMPDQAAVRAEYNPTNVLQSTVNNGATPRREGDTGSVEVFWPCVGEKRIVPDLISLYPDAGQQAPFAGATRPLCDRKEIALSDQMTALAKFYVFTSAHVASHFTGSITNDLASEFDPFSPQFGEKFAVPNLPVAVRDFAGKEISRVYGDQWGIYNGMTSSTWTVFPPSPSGYIPNMMIMCMNDPGPIPDPAHPGEMITDPNYNPAYSNFCYEMPYMPGQTTYLDTPVLPTMAFAAGYNLPDCDYPDTTPAIKQVNNSLGRGPWVDLGVPEVRATLSFNIGNVSQQTAVQTTPNDRVNSVSVGGTLLTSAALRCGPVVGGSTSVDCSSGSQNTRNNNMAAAVRANINANTSVGLAHGYTASGTNAAVTITAPVGSGATANGRTLAFNQTGLSSASGSMTGGVTAVAGSTSRVLTIAGLGDKPVLNNAYSGPQATAAPYNQKFITRKYGFGASKGSIAIGGYAVPSANVTGWSDTSITVDTAGLPLGAGGIPQCAIQQRGVTTPTYCGELEITTAAGMKSIDTVTVTIGGKAPIYVTPAGVQTPTTGWVDTDMAFGRLEPSPLQTAIDNAVPGDLIIVGPGTYRDNLLMWKPVRLQGVGAESVTINADAHPAGKMDAWRRQVNCMFGMSLDGRPLLSDGTYSASTYDETGMYTCPANMQQRVDRIPFETILGWDTTGNGNLAQMIQEPTLMGAYEGAGVTVLGRGVRIPGNSSDFWGSAAAGGFPAGYAYLTNSDADCTANTTTRNGRDYGTSNFNCNPSRVDGLSVINSSQGGGAIWAHAWNHNLEVSNNRVHSNHGTLTGGITIGNGEFPDAYVCDATVVDGTNPLPFGSNCDSTAEPIGYQYGYGFNVGTKVHHNMVTANASIGDALYSSTPSAAGGITFCSGADNYVADHNWVCGNLSSGDAGGLAHVGFINNGAIKNNWILFNQSQNATLPVNGGGIGVLGASPDRTLANGQECGAVTDTDCPPGLPEGTGRGLVIDANLVMGNSAESGTGGGIRLQMVNGLDVTSLPTRPALWNDVTLTNNIIANNVAGWDGGGVSLQDALKVRLINNTIMDNDTTASAGELFNTIGAVLAATPPPGCTPTTDPTQPQNPNCDSPVPTSTNQPAGVVSMTNTPNMNAAILALPNIGGGNKVVCPAGYGYYNADGTTLSNTCASVSLPMLMNDVIWKNRAFHVEVGDLGVGQQNTQKVVTLVPSLNQTLTGMCASVGTSNGAPGSGGPVMYWDIGVRGDAGPSSHQNANYRMRPRNSILTGGDYSGNGNMIGADPQVFADYCNGSRLPPEGGGVFAGFNAPAGRAETTGLYPVFSLNQSVAAPTVDEGNNWIDLSFGPLAPSVAANYTAAGVVLPPLQDSRLSSGSPAINTGVSSLLGNAAPPSDFFGHARSGNPDIGAVEYAAVAGPSASVSPGTLDFGFVAPAASGTTAAKILTLHNNSSSVGLTNISVTIAGTDFARPAGAAGGTCGTTLATGATCTINVVFNNTTTLGIKTGTAAITAAETGAVGGSPVALTVDVATPPALAVTPATPRPFAFGTVPTGTTSVKTLTLTNSGGSPFTGMSITVTGTGFSLSGGSCGTLLDVGPGCTIDVAFAPTSNGAQAGNVVISGDNASVPSVALSGTGQIQADLTVTKTDGVTTVAQGSTVTYSVVVTNNGPSPVTGATVTDTRVTTYLSSWSWTCRPVANCGGSTNSNTSQTGNISKTLATLAAGESVTFTVVGQVSYAATTGANTATVAVGGSGATDSNGANNTATDTNTIVVPTVKFTAGNGTGTLSGNTLDFGSQSGSVSNTVTLTVTGASATFGAPSLSGSNRYTLGANNCTGTQAAGSTCTITINFNANNNSLREGTLSVPYTGGVGSPALLNLSGS